MAGYFHHFSLFREFDDYQPKDIQLGIREYFYHQPTYRRLTFYFIFLYVAVVLAYVGVGTKIRLSLQTPNQKPNQVNFAVIISQDGALIIGGFERENDSCAEMMMVVAKS